MIFILLYLIYWVQLLVDIVNIFPILHCFELSPHDMPPQTAVNKEWRYIGMWLHACNWICRSIKSDTSDILQTKELFPSFLSLSSRETRLETRPLSLNGRLIWINKCQLISTVAVLYFSHKSLLLSCFYSPHDAIWHYLVFIDFIHNVDNIVPSPDPADVGLPWHWVSRTSVRLDLPVHIDYLWVISRRCH
jgi:hypothetical protein